MQLIQIHLQIIYLDYHTLCTARIFAFVLDINIIIIYSIILLQGIYSKGI